MVIPEGAPEARAAAVARLGGGPHAWVPGASHFPDVWRATFRPLAALAALLPAVGALPDGERGEVEAASREVAASVDVAEGAALSATLRAAVDALSSPSATGARAGVGLLVD